MGGELGQPAPLQPKLLFKKKQKKPQQRDTKGCSHPAQDRGQTPSTASKPPGFTVPCSAPPARSSSRHFCRAALSLFGHFLTRVSRPWGQARTNQARQPPRATANPPPGSAASRPGGAEPPAPRLLPEQKQLLLKGKESEEGGDGRRPPGWDSPRTGGQQGTATGTASPAVLTGISYGAGGSSRGEKAGNDPAKRAQGSNPFQFWAEDGQGKGRGSPGCGTPGRWHGRVMLLRREHGRRAAGAAGDQFPKAGPAEGHWVVPVNQAGGEAFSFAPNQVKPGAPAGRRDTSRGGASSSERWPPPGTPPSSGCGSGTFVFQFSFPRTATRSIAGWGTGPGAAATPCPPTAPPTSFPAGSAPARWKPSGKAFLCSGVPSGGSERAAGPRPLLRAGQEKHPDSRALNA